MIETISDLWTEHIQVAVSGAEFGHVISDHVEEAWYPERSTIDIELNADVVDFDDQCMDPLREPEKIRLGSAGS